MNPACNSARQSLIGTLPDSLSLGSNPTASQALGSVEERVAHEHLQGCVACGLWWKRQTLAVGVLGLRRTAPAELDARVSLTLEPAARRERALAAIEGLAPLTAPPELEQRLNRDLGSPIARATEALGDLRAPAVLERLVAEEIADPAAAAARRYSDRLVRLQAPPALERFAEGETETRRPRGGVLARASLATFLAAAGLVFVLTQRGDSASEIQSQRSWSFKVVRATSNDALSPLGRGLVEGLAGGAWSADRSEGGF